MIRRHNNTQDEDRTENHGCTHSLEVGGELCNDVCVCECFRYQQGCLCGWDSGDVQGRKERRGKKEGGKKTAKKQGTKTLN